MPNQPTVRWRHLPFDLITNDEAWVFTFGGESFTVDSRDLKDMLAIRGDGSILHVIQP